MGEPPRRQDAKIRAKKSWGGRNRRGGVPVHYKDAWVGEGRIDMVIGGVLVAELEALPEIATVHVCQALSYLKATGLRLALVLMSPRTR